MNCCIYRKQDIDKAYECGRKDGIRLSLDAILSTVTLKLQDKHNMPNEELNQLEKEVNGEFAEVLEDRITLDDIIEQKGLEIDDGDDKCNK
jgi:hypothetical protein